MMLWKRMTSALTAAAMTLGMLGTGAAVTAEDENGKLRVMPLGDSITDGFTGDPVGGYRLTLWQMLEENGYTDGIDFVGPNWGGDGIDPNHAGYSGYAIADIPGQRSGIYNFIDYLMENYPADVVMLQIGTNDILSSANEGAGDRLELLVDTILTYIPEGGLLYVSTIPYMDADVTTYTDAYTAEEMDAAVDAYNADLREIVSKKQAEGKPIAQADINAVLTKADLLDGVHPSAEGYRKMGEYWYGVLTDYINGEETPTQPTEPESTEPESTEPDSTEPESTQPESTEPESTEPESTEPPQTEPTDQPAAVKGDVDLDGTVGVSDIILLQKYLLGLKGLGAAAYANADLDWDGGADVFDLALLKRAVTAPTAELQPVEPTEVVYEIPPYRE